MKNTPTQFINIGYKKFQKLVDNIYQQILDDNWRPDYVVGITRGGLLPAVILSHRFKCPMYTLSVKLRDNPDTESNLWMAEDALGYYSQDDSREKKQILIVDDINDTGATLNWIQEDWMESCMPNHPNWDSVWGKNVRVATVFDKETSKSRIPVRYQGKLLKKKKCHHWIVFPYEPKPSDFS